MPDRRGHEPGYEQKSFPSSERDGKFRVAASPDGRDGSVTMHQDALLLVGNFGEGQSARYMLAPARHAWVHVARGTVVLNGTVLEAGDAAALDAPEGVDLTGKAAGEVLLFDLP